MFANPRQRNTVTVCVEKGAQVRGVERRLRTAQVIAAVGIEHAAVVPDLVGHVFQHAPGQFVLVVGNEAQADEVAVPAVHFVEAATGDDVGDGLMGVGVDFQGQQAGPVLDAFQIGGGERARHGEHVDVWMGRRDALVEGEAVGIVLRHVQVLFFAGALFVGQGGEQAGLVDAAGERFPVVVADQVIDAGQGLLGDEVAVEGAVFRQPEFLQQVGQLVRAFHIQHLAMAVLHDEVFRAGVLDGDGPAAVGVFLGEQGAQGGLPVEMQFHGVRFCSLFGHRGNGVGAFVGVDAAVEHPQGDDQQGDRDEHEIESPCAAHVLEQHADDP